VDVGVLVFGGPSLPMPGLGEYRGVLAPDTLFENDDGGAGGCLPGGGARVGLFLNGDSGRGKDGLFALCAGLGARAPGPTDCENLGML
jgi:hypothetical protein